MSDEMRAAIIADADAAQAAERPRAATALTVTLTVFAVLLVSFLAVATVLV